MTSAPTIAENETFLTVEEVAQRLRTKSETVRWWRHVGSGPPSMRAGRRVLYPLSALVAWEQAQLEASKR